MKQILRSIERRKKAVSKYKFRFEPKQLTVETKEKFTLDQIMLVCIHRKRRFPSKPRKLESSCTINCRRLVVWPESMVDAIEFETTLYSREVGDTPDDKNWTIVLEGTISKIKAGKVKWRNVALASAEINMKQLIGPVGEIAQLQIGMRVLHEGIKFCQVDLHVSNDLCEPEHGPPSTPSSILSTPQKMPVQSPFDAEKIEQPAAKYSSTMPTHDRRSSVTPPSTPSLGRSFPVLVQKATKPIRIEDQDDGPKDGIYIRPKLPSLSKQDHDTRKKIESIVEPSKPNHEEKHPSRPQSPTVTTTTPTWVAAPPPLRPSFTTQPAPPQQMLPNGHQMTKVPPTSAPARPEMTAATTNGWTSPRLPPPNSGIGRPKPVPPSQAEVEALIGQLIASKRPGMTSTPLSSRPAASNSSHENDRRNGTTTTTGAKLHELAASKLLMEKAKSIQEELKQIGQQFDEIEEQDQFVLVKTLDYEKDSDQERELMEHHYRLIGEKEQLSRRQDYLNEQLELNETEFKIAHLRSMLTASNGTSPEEEVDGSTPGSSLMHDHRRDSNKLLLELKELMDLKEQLTHHLSDMEAEDEEGMERNRLILERTRNQPSQFLRGQQEPLNVSKRLMGWLSGVEQRFKQGME